jgi:hypothetical protein
LTFPVQPIWTDYDISPPGACTTQMTVTAIGPTGFRCATKTTTQVTSARRKSARAIGMFRPVSLII